MIILIPYITMQPEDKIDQKEISIVSGIYPSFIYFPVPQQIKKSDHYSSLFKFLQDQNIPYSQVQQLHLSITRTLHILQAEAHQFHLQIKQYLTNHIQIVLLFDTYDILNDFIVLKCSTITSSKINPFVQRINTLLKKLSQPTYFQQPIYHVSVCRINTPPKDQLIKLLKSIKVPKVSYLLNKINLKMGNKVMSIN